MKPISIRLLIILIILFIALVFSAELRSEKPSKADNKKGPPPPTGVKVEEVKKEAIRETISIVGSVASPRVSRIGSEVDGIVEKIFIEEGDFVNKGKSLLQLTNSQLRINITAAKAEKEEALALWKKAEKEYQRYKRLIADKVIDERLLTNSQLEAEAAERAYHQKKSMEALLEDRLKKTTIYSPFSGVIMEKLVEIGEWVNTGQQVFRMSTIDPIRVTLPVPESIVGQISIGTEVNVKVEAFPDRTFIGKVYQIIPEAKKGSRTFPIILVLDNQKRLLKIGMMVRGMLPYGKNREALFVPQDAITVSQGEKIIYLVDKNNLAKRVPVKTGTMKKGFIEVNGDLSPGDLVVTRGGERLRPGIPLKILN